MSQSMFHDNPFTQLGASLRGLLTFSQFHEQGFVRVNADAAAFGAGGAVRFQGTLGTRLCGEVDNSTWLKRHFLPSRTANHLSVPIQGKRLLVKVLARTHRPG